MNGQIACLVIVFCSRHRTRRPASDRRPQCSELPRGNHLCHRAAGAQQGAVLLKTGAERDPNRRTGRVEPEGNGKDRRAGLAGAFRQRGHRHHQHINAEAERRVDPGGAAEQDVAGTVALVGHVAKAFGLLRRHQEDLSVRDRVRKRINTF